MRGRALGVVIAVLAVMGLLLLARVGARHAWRGFLDTVGWEMSWFEIGRESRSFDLAGAQTLVVENRFGDLEVLSGGPGVRVEGVLRAQGKDVTEARRRAAGLGVQGAREDAEAFKITGLGGDADHHLRMDLTVYAPPETAVRLRAFAGRVTVSDRRGAVSVEASAGNVEVSHCGGPVTIRAMAGTVRIEDATAGLTVTAMAGEITVDGARGPLNVHSSAGQVILSGLRSDQVAVSVGCGNVDIALAEPFHGTLTAESNAGDITIRLPRGSRARVVTDTKVGSINDHLPREVISRQGPGVIRAKTAAGSLSLLEAEPTSPD